MEIEVNLRLRRHQLMIHDEMKRWTCAVLARRSGKSFLCVALLIEKALTTDKSNLRLHYIGPSQRQARAIAWDYACSFVKDIPGVEIRQSDLTINFPNGARIEMLGVENADSLRGRFSDFCILDEAQLMPLSVFTYVIRPLLADREGGAFITGTPAGRFNLLGWAHETGQADPDNWFHCRLPHDQVDALPPSEIADMRRQMSPEAWRQEMEVDFEVALQGAYYSSQMHAAETEGRITHITHDPTLPVVCAVDLGFSDALAIWYAQPAGNTIQLFAYEEHHGMSLDKLADHWHAKPFPIEKVLLPHDIKVRELGTGQSRLEILRKRGVTGIVVRNLPIHDGIEATRMLLPRCWFDRERCAPGLEALRSYRAEYDEKRQVQRMIPRHDHASHGSDALRYLAVGLNVAAPSHRQSIDPFAHRRKAIRI